MDQRAVVEARGGNSQMSSNGDNDQKVYACLSEGEETQTHTEPDRQTHIQTDRLTDRQRQMQKQLHTRGKNSGYAG